MNSAAKARAMLRGNRMSSLEVAKRLGVTVKAAEGTLRKMPDSYVAEWIGPIVDPDTMRPSWHRVWSVVEVPKDARKPLEKKR